MSRPYFETKVVKVKKECEHLQIYYKPGMIGYRCHNCGNIVDVNRHEIKKQPKGNWVNGENLDKIKFPCFCSFSNPHLRDKRYGVIMNIHYDMDFMLFELGEGQSYGVHYRGRELTLKKLIKAFDVHILKGKIIIYEEE